MYWVTFHPHLYTEIINIFNSKWKGITSDTEYLHKLAAPQGANFGLPSLQTSGFMAVIEPFLVFTMACMETAGGQDM